MSSRYGWRSFQQAVEDAHPLEGQGAHRRMVRFLLRALLVVISLRPGAERERAVCPFVEGLALKFRTSTPHVHPLRVSAGCFERSDAGKALQIRGRFKSLAAGCHVRH